jgi:hypothetical protein
MKCKKCGAENLDAASRCMDCGAKLGGAQAASASPFAEPKPSQTSSHSTIVILAVVAVAAVILSAVVFGVGSGGGGGGGGSMLPRGGSATATGEPAPEFSGSSIVTEPVSPADSKMAMGVAAPIVKRAHPEYETATSTVTAYASQGASFVEVTYARFVEWKNPDGSITHLPRILVVSIARSDGKVTVYEGN